MWPGPDSAGAMSRPNVLVILTDQLRYPPASILFWLCIVGRLVIVGATLNAAVHDQRGLPDQARA